MWLLLSYNSSVNVEMSLLLKVEEVASLKSKMRADVKEKVDKGLRNLPFEMVCAYQSAWTAANSIVNYDRITVEFNNSNRPGGLFVQIYSHSVAYISLYFLSRNTRLKIFSFSSRNARLKE